MTDEGPKNESPPSNNEVRRVWDANAEWWDDRIGDGNQFQVELIEPATERLLGDIAGLTVLDVACGAGRFARRMAALGARVVALDFSEKFIARARSRTAGDADIEFHVIDATDRDAMVALGAGRFDAAAATMALMDMTEIDPLMAALAELLKPGGRFVLTICHPCFDGPGGGKFAETVETDGRAGVRTGVKVSSYLTPRAWKSEGIVGQPELQYYFHRPLSVLFGAAFAHGFVVDGLDEPGFPHPRADGRWLRWDSNREIPPVLAVRLRLT